MEGELESLLLNTEKYGLRCFLFHANSGTVQQRAFLFDIEAILFVNRNTERCFKNLSRRTVLNLANLFTARKRRHAIFLVSDSTFLYFTLSFFAK